MKKKTVKNVIYSQTEPEYLKRLAKMKKELNLNNIDSRIDFKDD